MKKWIKRIVLILVILLVLIALSILGLNLWVTLHAKKNIVSSSQELTRNYDCILILGAGLKNGQASPMLTDRLEKGIELYKQGKAPKLLMSGDHGTEYYNEVKVMKSICDRCRRSCQVIFSWIMRDFLPMTVSGVPNTFFRFKIQLL